MSGQATNETPAEAELRFVDLPSGGQFLRTDAHGQVDLCVKLRFHAGECEWNTVYLSGAYAGMFCGTFDDAVVKLPPDSK